MYRGILSLELRVGSAQLYKLDLVNASVTLGLIIQSVVSHHVKIINNVRAISFYCSSMQWISLDEEFPRVHAKNVSVCMCLIVVHKLLLGITMDIVIIEFIQMPYFQLG